MAVHMQAPIRLRRGDEVIVISGEDRGRRGKIVRVDREKGRVVVEGVNKAKVHQRPTQKAPQGGIVEKELPINVSNVRYWDVTEEKPSKVVFRTQEDGKRIRVSKVSGETIEV